MKWQKYLIVSEEERFSKENFFSAMKEEWRDIEGYENKYQISNYGRLKSLSFGIMKPMKATNGYLIACLWKNGKQKKIVLHRLVAKSFIKNPNEYPEVNHIDENKENNRCDNLEWCTHSYNLNFGTVKERISKSNKGKKISNEMLAILSSNAKDRIWINDGNVERLIKYYDFEPSMYVGWVKGRIKK